MMRVYEKYLARQIYLAFLFVLLAFVGLFVFFDLVSELGDVGRGGYRFQHALAYVLLFAPQRMYEIIPVASLIARSTRSCPSLSSRPRRPVSFVRLGCNAASAWRS